MARCACSATRKGLHQPINLSATEPAIAIVARNDPQEQEHVELLAPPAGPFPTLMRRLVWPPGVMDALSGPGCPIR